MKLKIVGGLVLLAVVAGGLLVYLTRESAQADFTSSDVKDLAAYLAGNHPANLELCALCALRKKTDSGVEAALEKVAKKGDPLVAIAACTQLGQKGTSDAKDDLKSILTDTDLDVSVRIGALSAIAYGWKDSGDIDYLTSKTKSNTKLSGQLTWLENNVYGK